MIIKMVGFKLCIGKGGTVYSCGKDLRKIEGIMIMKRIRFNLKKKWMNYLNRLAKVNHDLYGVERLDCCDLNKKGKRSK